MSGPLAMASSAGCPGIAAGRRARLGPRRTGAAAAAGPGAAGVATAQRHHHRVRRRRGRQDPQHGALPERRLLCPLLRRQGRRSAVRAQGPLAHRQLQPHQPPHPLPGERRRHRRLKGNGNGALACSQSRSLSRVVIAVVVTDILLALALGVPRCAHNRFWFWLHECEDAYPFQAALAELLVVGIGIADLIISVCLDMVVGCTQ